MTWVEIILWLLVAVLVALPPRFDPAIRLKEFNERKRFKGE